jgi:hypothetical protein
MIEHFEQNTNHSISLEIFPIFLGPSVSLYNVNFIFLILLNTNNNDHCRNINIYSATVSDRMHHLDLGLFNYQIIYTRELLK